MGKASMLRTFLTFLFLSLSLGTFAQKRVSVNVSNATLTEVFNSIEKQTSYRFSYRNVNIDNRHDITLSLRNASVSSVLNAALQDRPLTYSIVSDESIVIVEKSESNSASKPTGKKHRVAGTVLDSQGEPVIGASVVEKGTKNATVTDLDGKYSLDASSNSTIVFSYIGAATKEVRYNGQNSLNVTLQDDAQQVQEVVVTALGITRDQKALGYSMTSLKGDEIAKSNAANPILGMQGKVAGVQIDMGSSGPQSSNRIIIRGNSSLGSNNQPIFVVDGVIIDNEVTKVGEGRDFGNELKNINNDDIESMSILKGAAATALYGSRAANGVIVIKTKRGITGSKFGISISQTEQWEKVYDSLDYQNWAGSGSYPAWPLTASGTESRTLTEGDRSFGAPFDDKDVTIGGVTTKWSAQPNNWKQLYQTGRYSNTNIALQGGDATGAYRFSYSNLRSKGYTFYNQYNRNSFSLNADRQINKYLKAESGFSYIHSYAQNPQWQGGGSNLIYNFTSNISREYDTNYWRQHYKADNGDGYNGAYDPYYFNEDFYKYMENRYIQKEDNIRAYTNVTFQILPWLAAVAKGDIYMIDTNYQEKILSDGTKNYENASYKINDTKKRQYRITGMLTANKSWGDFTVNGAVACEQWDTRTDYHNSYSVGGLREPGLFDMTNSVKDAMTSVRLNAVRKRINSVYAFADMSYRDVYFLDITGRNDWSSALIYSDGHGHTSYFYPSFSGSWLFVQDLRKHMPKWISFGKLRASYAIVGNDIEPYVTTATGFYSYGGVFTSLTDGSSLPYYKYDSSSLPNNNLKPEKQYSVELGLEMRFFDNRLGFDLAWYKTNTHNQALSLPIAPETGVSSRYINAGNIQNKGLEFMITGTPIQTKDFSWDLSFNCSRNRNKIIALAPGVTKYALPGGGADCTAYATVGGAYGDIYTPHAYARNDKGEKLLSADGKWKRAGVSTKVGSLQPDFLWGASTTLRYKGVSLDCVLDARVGGDIFSLSYNYGTAMGNLKHTLYGRTKEWGGLARTLADGRTVYDGMIPDGVFDTGTTINGVDVSGMSYQEAYEKGLVNPISAKDYYVNQGRWGYGIREFAIMRCSWIALRSLSLNWNVPRAWANKLYMQSITLSLVGRNLCYLYNSLPDNIHPEGLSTTYSSEFFEGGGSVYTRNIGFSINVSF
jgi:iron complex outermembrane receptor protein